MTLSLALAFGIKLWEYSFLWMLSSFESSKLLQGFFYQVWPGGD
jgi:hypothetical protein